MRKRSKSISLQEVYQLNTPSGSPWEIHEELEKVRALPREVGDDSDEDTVMDVMDRVLGFCSPSARL